MLKIVYPGFYWLKQFWIFTTCIFPCSVIYSQKIIKQDTDFTTLLIFSSIRPVVQDYLLISAVFSLICKFPCFFYISNIKEASETCFTIRGGDYIDLEHVTTLRKSLSSTRAYIRWTVNYREYKRLQVKSFHVHNIIPYQNTFFMILCMHGIT